MFTETVALEIMKQTEIDQGLCDPEFELEEFFPYKVRVFYADVTRALSVIYQRDFDLSPAEWRTMAILGAATTGLHATEIVARSSMDKVMVSRTVKRMEKRGLLTREANATDGRSFLLKLSEEGLAAYNDLAPKLLAVEQKMLAGLDETELKTLLDTMQKIRLNIGDGASPDI